MTVTGAQHPKRIRILFDETHSESWSVSREVARQISPGYPEYSSYQHAADLLAQREFSIARHTEGPLDAAVLAFTDIVVLAHPCDPRWERTLPGGSPRLTPDEIASLNEFVARGGSLLVITEYEHEKYGDNLNDLLEPYGIRIEGGTVLDRSHNEGGNPAWVLARPGDSDTALQLTSGVTRACFYQTGSCSLREGAQSILESSPDALPPRATLLAASTAGRGRVVVACDSLLFGDDHLPGLDHSQLWLNVCYWLAVPGLRETTRPQVKESVTHSPAWHALKAAVNVVRLLQQPDGSVAPGQHGEALAGWTVMRQAVSDFTLVLPHQEDYLRSVGQDLDSWKASGFARPDFRRSLEAYSPQKHRIDALEVLAVFPLYTPNACLQTRFEALVMRVPWPDWLAGLERAVYPNPQFAPGHLVDYSEGYRSECAVLFPETVSVSGKGVHRFATIFCDREAARLQSFASRAARLTRLPLPPEFEALLSSRPMLEDVVALWDLIHDRSHSLGELPFDPFMIRQRAPFWMYAIEELRVDLRSFAEARKLVAGGFHLAQHIPAAILFDRIFRFPIVGTRVKNYDGLAGQLLFAFLHDRDCIGWCDNRLSVDWARLPDRVEELRRDLANLYRHGATCSKLSFWIEAHDLISRHVRPNVASRWRKESRAIDSESDPAKWLALVEPDEFPLGTFHTNLARRLAEE